MLVTYPINGIKECVEEPISLNLTTGIVIVIRLIQRDGLRVDNRIRKLEVQIGLRTSIKNVYGR